MKLIHLKIDDVFAVPNVLQRFRVIQKDFMLVFIQNLETREYFWQDDSIEVVLLSREKADIWLKLENALNAA